jgi:three-Cys-motif partner protein
MKKHSMPSVYIDREQTYIKHTILKSYLQRLFMIVGKRKVRTINYIDCFSGPWMEGDEQLRDTSIAISLKAMMDCRQMLKEMYRDDVTFRALYIERDPASFAKLRHYLDGNPFPEIETHCIHGDYTSLIPEIIEWQKSYFSFFFVDPTGWQQVVGGETMRDLLRLPNTEFLINLMYEFINRFVEYERHSGDMVELFGKAPQFTTETPEQRKAILLTLYRNNINRFYDGRSAYVPVEKPGTQKVLFFLVYLTRSPKGIEVFKTEAEKMEIVQRITQQEVRLRNKAAKTGIDDLFADEAISSEQVYEDNRLEAKEFLLSVLSPQPLLIDLNLWASWLEKTDLYPTDFQMAMKELIHEGVVKNLDANVRRRRTDFIKPSWPDKSEHWVLVG